MASPYIEVDANGRIVGGPDGKIYDIQEYLAELQSGAIWAPPSAIQSHANGPTYTGDLSNENSGDMIAVELVAGQTYTWSYRGTVDGVVDPWLRLYAPDGTTLITEDDDGGYGRTSQITFTATESGTYYLNATSWYQVDPTAPDYQDNGDYTIVQWSPDSSHDAGSSIATAGTIEVGTNYNYFEAQFDQDMYAINLTAGQVYTFTFNGGVSSGADWDDEPGESIGVLALYDSAGNSLVPFTVNYETTITFIAQDTGTYYLQAIPYSSFGGVPGPEMTGGYTIDVTERALADMDPLESLNWDSAANIPTVMVDGVPTAYVYFAPAGEHFGETNLDGTPMTTYGWNQKEMDAVMLALAQYTPITGINYVITTDADQATFRMITTAIPPGTPGAYGAYAYPQAPNYGDAAGIVVFNVNSGGWDKPGVSVQDIPGDQVSLDQGGFSFAVILHELGHAHGIAHPHDTGGGSEIMLGVTASQGSYGIYDLNQGVYTVMSYNDAWDLHPDGPSSFTIAGIDNGWSGTLGAFDIAVLQARYGSYDYNTGDNVYMLTDVADDAYYQTIWDTGGKDTIAYNGALDAHIDLLAATLDYSPTGGGVISFLYNEDGVPANQQVKGGFTIANGVVIENATGGSGNDVLLGNSANNVLTGNAGNDILMGREGDDKLYGGDGDDVLNGGSGTNHLFGGAGTDVFAFTDAGVNHLKDYEAGEKIDLSALGVTMDDVTVKKGFILVDLEGSDDLKIVVDTNKVSLGDLIFESESASATQSSGGAAGLGSGEINAPLIDHIAWVVQPVAQFDDYYIV